MGLTMKRYDSRSSHSISFTPHAMIPSRKLDESSRWLCVPFRNRRLLQFSACSSTALMCDGFSLIGSVRHIWYQSWGTNARLVPRSGGDVLIVFLASALLIFEHVQSVRLSDDLTESKWLRSDNIETIDSTQMSFENVQSTSRQQTISSMTSTVPAGLCVKTATITIRAFLPRVSVTCSQCWHGHGAKINKTFVARLDSRVCQIVARGAIWTRSQLFQPWSRGLRQLHISNKFSPLTTSSCQTLLPAPASFSWRRLELCVVLLDSLTQHLLLSGSAKSRESKKRARSVRRALVQMQPRWGARCSYCAQRD